MATHVATLSSGDYDLAYVLSPEFPDPIARVLPRLRGGGMAVDRWTIQRWMTPWPVICPVGGRRRCTRSGGPGWRRLRVIPLVRVRANHATRSGAIVPRSTRRAPAVPDRLAAA